MARIRSDNVRRARRIMRDATMAELATQVADADVPEALVEHETSERFSEFQRSLERSGMSYEDFFTITHQDAEEFAAMLREEGRRGAKVDLALRAVVAQERARAHARRARRRARAPGNVPAPRAGQLRDELERAGRLGALRAEKGKSKAADFVVEHVTYVDPEGVEIAPELLEIDDDTPGEYQYFGEDSPAAAPDALDQIEGPSDTTEDE